MTVKLITFTDGADIETLATFTVNSRGAVEVDSLAYSWMLEPIRFGARRVFAAEGEAFLRALTVAYAGSLVRAIAVD